MVNQAFRIKIAYRSEKEEKKVKKKEKIPGIGRYPMGPTMMKDRGKEGTNKLAILGWHDY